MKTINFILVAVLFTQFGLAQSLSQKDLNEQVQGIYFYGNSSFLVTAQGFIQIPDQEINDEYQNYYRKVYGDSTIINPNTILQPNSDSEILQYIVPFINIGEMGKDFINLPEDFQLNDFLDADNSGKVEFRQGIYTIISKYLEEQKTKK